MQQWRFVGRRIHAEEVTELCACERDLIGSSASSWGANFEASIDLLWHPEFVDLSLDEPFQ